MLLAYLAAKPEGFVRVMWDLCGELGLACPRASFTDILDVTHKLLTPGYRQAGGKGAAPLPSLCARHAGSPMGSTAESTTLSWAKETQDTGVFGFCPAAASTAGPGAIALLQGKRLLITASLEAKRKTKPLCFAREPSSPQSRVGG